MRSSWARALAVAAAVAGLPSAAAAQAALTTDLWRVAAGTLVGPAALTVDGSAPLWTPAVAISDSGVALRLGVESIHAPADAGVTGTVATASYRPASGLTLHLVYGRVSVGDLVRTETSPEGVGDIPAYSQVVSLGAAHTLAGGAVTIGAAVRALTAQLDVLQSTRLAGDVGLVYDARHLRLGVATRFFDARAGGRASGTVYSLGAEVRTDPVMLWGAPTGFRFRYGVGLTGGEGPAHVLSVGASLAEELELDAGAAREETAGTAVWRSRFGAAVSAGRYRVYVKRDGGVNGFGATYRFGLTVTVR